MALDVKVKIDLTYPAGNLGFGYPLILSVGEDKDYAEYTNLDDIVTAGFADTTDVYKAAALMFAQNNPPEKVAICGVASTSELRDIKDKGWRQLVAVGADDEDVTAIAAYVANTEDKMYFCCCDVNESPTVDSLAIVSDRVALFHHTDPIAVAALVGEAAGRPAGSFTYKNLKLNGIELCGVPTTGDEKIICFVNKAGDNVTSGGKTMGGEYIDIIDSKDWIVQQIAYKTQKVLNGASKVPYDNNGIAMLESAAVNVLQEAYNNGMIATDEDGSPAYTVSYALSNQVSDSDRDVRKYAGGKFSFKLAGAIHTAEIHGEIII